MKKKLWQKISLAYWPIFFLPLYLIRFEFVSIPMNLLEIITVMIFVILLFFDHRFLLAHFVVFGKKYLTFLIPAGVIILGLIIGTARSGNYEVGLGIIKGWFLFPMMIWFLADFGVISGEVEEEKKKVYQIYLVSSVGLGLIAFVYWIGSQLTFDGRLQAIYNSPNYLAMALAPGLLSAFFFYFRENKNKYVYLAAIIFLATILCMTGSIASWLAIISSLLVTLFWSKQKTLYIWIFIVVSILTVTLFWQMNQERIQVALDGLERSSWASRLMIWNTSAKIIGESNNWILGIGAGNFQEAYLENQKYFPQYLEWAVPHPHNTFLAFWLYSGIAGLVAFLFILVVWFRKAYRLTINASLCIAFSVMIYILAHGIFDTTYFKNDLAVMFWMTLLALNVKKLSEREQ